VAASATPFSLARRRVSPSRGDREGTVSPPRGAQPRHQQLRGHPPRGRPAEEAVRHLHRPERGDGHPNDAGRRGLAPAVDARPLRARPRAHRREREEDGAGLALALRANAPIFAAESLLEEVGAVPQESADDEGEILDEFRDFIENINPDDFNL
jgi:hypothetical protein